MTNDEITAIAHRIASKYSHRSDPTYIACTFLPHTLLDFARKLIDVATLDERERCENLVLELPMKQSGMYWNDHCKSFAFYAATCIKAPEIFDQDFNVHTPEDKP